ncbi:malonate decarboxylase subunit delta [Desertibacillus haloalkaliphilus]|uniref:malonate decarboxylase subunit delta n=1 Tax=Desertibacillus haloalkaliphilus TaxID=1328930 RepID=UPI001C279E83|nr:malonate decarboxylase subunit delta [Desertibacillus haloalkaliphilus]MBU8908284.1 malonate decarboxylase subunit delta [Desertibacillus haloalkaliphilus]
MENLTYTFPAREAINKRAHVGVVGSGDLEIIMESSDNLEAKVVIRTGINGFKETWEAVLQRFFEKNDIAAHVKINDFGATPGVVTLRLEQALEVSRND